MRPRRPPWTRGLGSRRATRSASRPSILPSSPRITSSRRSRMQLSGEPFAEAMVAATSGGTAETTPLPRGRLLAERVLVDPALPPRTTAGPVGRIDLAGFSSGIESYEYSKQPMVNATLPSSPARGRLAPLRAFVLNPTAVTGTRRIAARPELVPAHGRRQQRSDPTLRERAVLGDGNILGWPRPLAHPPALVRHVLEPGDPADARHRVLDQASDDDPWPGRCALASDNQRVRLHLAPPP